MLGEEWQDLRLEALGDVVDVAAVIDLELVRDAEAAQLQNIPGTPQ